MRTIDLPYAPTLCDMPARCLDDWKLSLDDIVTPGDILLPGDMSEGEIRAGRLMGGGVLATVQLGLSEVRHEWSHLQNLAGDDVIVLIVLDGCGTVTQQERTLPFNAGDITFRRARVPSTARIDEPAKFVMLRLPITRFFGRAMSRFSPFAPACASGESGIVLTVHRFIESVLPSLRQQSANTAAAAEQSLVSLLAAAYLESAGDATVEPVAGGANPLRWSQLRAFIASNLHDPELDVEACAKALSVSKRYVHKMFEANGTHYGRFVLEHRLARSRDDMTNPLCTELSIERIAYRNGFNDPAHFSRSFRTMFGTTPGAYRKQCSGAVKERRGAAL
ncbi:Transcriptional activator NphR [Paraburkholderia sediminicola]|uniref:Transcriptional activator NphR n=1 Tax=Paraburkholderia sediminicola TaxID=458836 RepID=A0A6J5AIE2_9BURK|nr:helix-turn-helix domain-containing protein [Paraburkholderia sediminicola]CAB3647516.1 Transcriptional activator NphR [Paraburkholderia sediminicola]